MGYQSVFPELSLRVIDSEKASLLANQDPIHVFRFGYRGHERPHNWFLFSRSGVYERLCIYAENYATDVNEVKKAFEKDFDEPAEILAVGWLTPKEIDFRIPEIHERAVSELIARAFGSIQPDARNHTEFFDAQVLINSMPTSLGMVTDILDDYGLASNASDYIWLGRG